MESQAKYILVGSFVLILSVLFLASLLWLAEMTGGRDEQRYTVYFRRQTLDGLQKDADVTMKGIKVGSVEDYSISSKNIEEVKVTLRLDATTPVKVDTEIVIRRNLLTGLAWLDLVHGTQESAPLEQPRKGEEYPVIPEGRSEFEVIADSIPSLLEEISELLTRITMVFSEENVDSVSSILKNVDKTAAGFVESRKKLDSLMVETEKTIIEVRKMSSSTERLAGNADVQVRRLGKELAEALVELKKAVDSLDKEATKMGRSVRTASQVFSQEVTTVGQSISEAANTFSKTLESFEDPQAIIAGPREKALGPGERIKE